MHLLDILEAKGEIKVTPVSVQDHYRGESFGHKYLTVDGVVKVAADINLVGQEVRIQNIDTAEDAQRQGLATMLVDDLFKEFDPKEHVFTTSGRTEDGSGFFQQYHPKGEYIFPRNAPPPDDWEEEVVYVDNFDDY